MGQIKAKTQIQKLGFRDTDKKDSKHDEIQIWAYENAETILRETVLKNKEFQLKYRKWEKPLIQVSSTDFKQVLGFIDLEFQFEADFYFKPHDEYERETRCLMIEVKTKIPNLGELVRQINFYRSFRNIYETYYMVISPDDRFKKILNEQGIWFYKYKDPNLLF